MGWKCRSQTQCIQDQGNNMCNLPVDQPVLIGCLALQQNHRKTSVLFFHNLGLACNTSAPLPAFVVCNTLHKHNTNMSTSSTTGNKSVCAKCGRSSYQNRYPLVECNQCNRLFHTTCLLKSYVNKKQYLSCADCKDKCINVSMRESQQSGQSSASTSKTNVRKSAGSSIAISAARQSGNSNKPQTINRL